MNKNTLFKKIKIKVNIMKKLMFLELVLSCINWLQEADIHLIVKRRTEAQFEKTFSMAN